MSLLSPWSDWQMISFGSALWHNFTGGVPSAPPTPAALVGATMSQDQIDFDTFAATNRRGGAIQKPTWSVLAEGTPLRVVGYQTQLAVPGYVVDKRQQPLVEWTGITGDEMGEVAGYRVALEIENAVFCTTTQGQVGGLLSRFALSGKFRGYGMPVGGDQTEDTCVGTDDFGTFGVASAFPEMAIPADGSADPPPDTSAGIVIFRHLIDVPETVATGDIVELCTYAQLDAPDPEHPETVMQWLLAKYRWIVPPYTQLPNTGVQVPADEQPRFDSGQYEP